MGFLHLLEGLRTPILNAFFSLITLLGDETCFMALTLAVFWCISKRRGYYLFAVGLFGIVINQFLKLCFRIPRPWVQDSSLTIVESARSGATGYSFPSGHTQNIVGTVGVIAVTSRRTWVWGVCGALAILVPFSRMYLGVHTPLDVAVAFLTALILLALLWPFFRDETSFQTAIPYVLLAMAVLSAAYIAYTIFYHFPADLDPENYAHGVKNGYTMLGCALGLLVVYFYDHQLLRFDTWAPLLGQVLKLGLGLGLLIGLRVVLKAPLTALFHGHDAANAVRYFLMVIFAGCIWPHTFPLFAHLGGRRTKPVL